MTDRRRMKLTQEQVFERWWATQGPRSYPTLPLSDADRQRIHDWASIAFRRGYELGRKRQRERSRS